VIAQVGDTVYWMEEQKIMEGRYDREAINHQDEAIVHVSDGTVRVLNVFGLYVSLTELIAVQDHFLVCKIEKINEEIGDLKKDRLKLEMMRANNQRFGELKNG